MMIEVDTVKAEFKDIFQTNIKRDGADVLLEWIEASDFFTAPASSRYHLAVEGGLCQHSLNVYKRLCKLLNDEYGESPYTPETISIVSLLHDLCKANMYKPGWRNQKTYDPAKVAAAERYQVKHDAAGDFIWETVPSYEIDEKFVFGHGEKSVFIIQNFMKLQPVEASAIRYHMSSWQEGEAKSAGETFRRNPLAFFVHIADEAATFLDESEEP